MFEDVGIDGWGMKVSIKVQLNCIPSLVRYRLTSIIEKCRFGSHDKAGAWLDVSA